MFKFPTMTTLILNYLGLFAIEKIEDLVSKKTFTFKKTVLNYVEFPFGVVNVVKLGDLVNVINTKLWL